MTPFGNTRRCYKCKQHKDPKGGRGPVGKFRCVDCLKP